jgi:hypothetical protein
VSATDQAAGTAAAEPLARVVIAEDEAIIRLDLKEILTSPTTS